jgi:hypothetical protein
VRAVRAALTTQCYEKCVPKPSSALSSSEEVSRRAESGVELVDPA